MKLKQFKNLISLLAVLVIGSAGMVHYISPSNAYQSGYITPSHFTASQKDANYPFYYAFYTGNTSAFAFLCTSLNSIRLEWSGSIYGIKVQPTFTCKTLSGSFNTSTEAMTWSFYQNFTSTNARFDLIDNNTNYSTQRANYSVTVFGGTGIAHVASPIPGDPILTPTPTPTNTPTPSPTPTPTPTNAPTPSPTLTPIPPASTNTCGINGDEPCVSEATVSALLNEAEWTRWTIRKYAKFAFYIFTMFLGIWWSWRFILKPWWKIIVKAGI